MTATGFAGDRGDADPRVVAALADLADTASMGAGGAGGADRAARESRLVSLLAQSRVLVAVVPAPPEPTTTESAGTESAGTESAGREPAAEGTHSHPRPATEMAAVTLTGPDGTTALPAFTSVAALAAWDPSARPVPLTTVSAAQAALDEGCAVLLVDLGSQHAAVLRSSMLWALAQEREWVPPYDDPLVREALAAASAATPDVLAAEARDGSERSPGVTEIDVTVPAGLGPERVERLVLALGERLSADPQVRCRLDELAVRLSTAPR